MPPATPAWQDWEVDLFDSNNNFIASQLTDANGDFDFEGLDPGTYTVEEFVQAGWTQTAPPPPGTFTVTVTAGGVVSGLQFGNFQDITISGEVFNDLNGNGTQDPGDPGLPGWTVDLVRLDRRLGRHHDDRRQRRLQLQRPWPRHLHGRRGDAGRLGADRPGASGHLHVHGDAAARIETGLNFGDFELVTYTGTVYNDLNGSGVIDPGDPGLQGWTVELLDSNGNIVATTTSAADGSYSFADLALRRLHDRGDPSSRLVSDRASRTRSSTRVTATSGASQSGLNFGNFQLVNVTGEVYNDLNGNGNLDPGEPGLQGWTVNLLDQAGNIVATTTSDANGNYEFDNLFPGTFIVEEVLQSGWTQTQPVNPELLHVRDPERPERDRAELRQLQHGDLHRHGLQRLER